jgi:hypothetical protein
MRKEQHQLLEFIQKYECLFDLALLEYNKDPLLFLEQQLSRKNTKNVENWSP